MLPLGRFAATVAALVLLAAVRPVVAQAPQTPQTPQTSQLAVEPDGELPLEGTTWRLRQFRGPEGERMVGPEVAAWMSLRSGSLEGSGGCDRLRGRYGRMGEALRFTLRDPHTPRAAQTPRDAQSPGCGEQASVVELAMGDALRRASTFQIVPSEEPLGAELILRDHDGAEILRFVTDDVGSLADEEWHLTSYTVDGRTQPAATSQAALLAFEVDGGSALRRQWEGNVVGSSGCNGIVGRYARDADVIRFRDLETTPAPCSTEFAAQEAAMLSVLLSAGAGLRLDLPPDRLSLSSPETDDRLEFVTSTPLEGSTWLLATLPDQPDAGSLVTLRLEQGLVSGEGPCGPYSGSYVTDGLFIRFDAMRGSGAADCSAQSRQRALLRAFERAVLLDRDQPQLRLLDAGGELMARFKRPAGP